MSLFTVEQLELIRRLKATGITPPQVIEAFAQLNIVEESHCSPPMVQQSNSPILLQALRAQPPVAVNISASTSEASSISMQRVPQASAANEHDDPMPVSSPLLFAIPSLPSVGRSLTPSTPIPGGLTFMTPNNRTTPPMMNNQQQILAPRQLFDNNAGGRPVRSVRTPMNDIITLDDPNELEEFMTQGEEACIADMKAFINQYSLRQTTVAMMTAVSQPYISKLLNGNHRELSLRCRKNIYCWYLNCRRHPQKLAAFLADPSSRLEANVDGELLPQRRERYVFRPILLRMLEGFFGQTPFPDSGRRLEIATACNNMLQIEKRGVALMPKEVVSPQVVANWFANKRKELRRRSAETQDQFQNMNPASTSQHSNHGSNDDNLSNSSSTPSPRLEDGCSPEVLDLFNRPMDMISLAARLGITLPQPDHPMLTPLLPENLPPSLPAPTLPLPLTLASLGMAQNPLLRNDEVDNSIMTSLASQYFPQVSLALAASTRLSPMSTSPTGNGEIDLNHLRRMYEHLAKGHSVQETVEARVE